jgi:hypothetical protein
MGVFSYEDLTSDRVGVEMGFRYLRALEEAGISPNDKSPEALEKQAQIMAQTKTAVGDELSPVDKETGRKHYGDFLYDHWSILQPEPKEGWWGRMRDKHQFLLDHTVDHPQDDDQAPTPFYDKLLSPIDSSKTPDYLKGEGIRGVDSPSSVGQSVAMAGTGGVGTSAVPAAASAAVGGAIGALVSKVT